MKLLFKQKIFSWFDSYNIYDESGNIVYTVEGKLSWGHKLHVLDSHGVHIGTVKETVLTFLPRFDLYVGNNFVGSLKKQLTFFKPAYVLDFKGWSIKGDFWEWDYSIYDSSGRAVAKVSKELFHLTDTYVINVASPADALYALMFTLAIDAEKCSRR